VLGRSLQSTCKQTTMQKSEEEEEEEEEGEGEASYTRTL
jgi:hypothetical protein